MLLTLSMVMLPCIHFPAVENKHDISPNLHFRVQCCHLFAPNSAFQFADILLYLKLKGRKSQLHDCMEFVMSLQNP